MRISSHTSGDGHDDQIDAYETGKSDTQKVTGEANTDEVLELSDISLIDTLTDLAWSGHACNDE